ncbi:MAG: PHP domain-containing protein [Treponema sp.]|nr:PHP domain-containing protein [Treponema sp.]
MPYLYETHIHTKESSACGVSPGREYIKKYKDLGYTGIIVTDHFYRGNCAIPRSLPWDKWVHSFCRGYEEAHDEGIKQGFDVFFGWEETYDGDDYLVYGLDKKWLLEHPEVIFWTRAEQLREVRRGGGCVVQAHPFRQYYYISSVILSSGCVDAVEAANAGNEQSFDALALAYANKFHLNFTAGSDIHYSGDIKRGTVFGVYLDKKMETIYDYANSLRGGTIAGLHIPPNRCKLHGNERVLIPVDIRDANDRSTRITLVDILKP